MGNQADEFDALDRRLGDPQPAKPRARGLGTLSAPTNLMRESEEIRSAQRRVQELLKQAGAPRVLKLVEVHRSPYQTRSLSAEAIQTLADNLRDNPLATPIVVRERGTGGFEIIAGHRRTAAFELLNRSEIPAVVVAMSDEEAEAAVFYDNFFPSDISDYEKYLGLQQIRLRGKYTIDQLAERSGISRSLVGYLLAFEKLPDSVHKILQDHPALLSATLAAKLAALAKSSEPRMVEGVGLLAGGQLRPAQLLEWIENKPAPKKQEPTIIRAGKAKFAQLVYRESRIVIDFADAADAAAAQRALEGLLRERATTKKKD